MTTLLIIIGAAVFVLIASNLAQAFSPHREIVVIQTEPSERSSLGCLPIVMFFLGVVLTIILFANALPS